VSPLLFNLLASESPKIPIYPIHFIQITQVFFHLLDKRIYKNLLSENSVKHYTKKMKAGQALFFKAFFPLTALFLSAIEYHKILGEEERAPV
jgi:hypothetical protein